MMARESVMDAHRLARTTDPASSHMAAREHVESGRNESQKAEVYGLVRWLFFTYLQPLTSAEIALLGEQNRYMVARRLADLLAEGKVIQSPRDEMRKCRVSGRLAVTWRLA